MTDATKKIFQKTVTATDAALDTAATALDAALTTAMNEVIVANPTGYLPGSIIVGQPVLVNNGTVYGLSVSFQYTCNIPV